jgi:aspartate aminotransferase-like enzyme
VEWQALNARLRDGENLVAAGGQGHLAGKIVRIAHMGYVDGEHIIAAAEGLARALTACGYRAAPEAASAAARRVLDS